jgi:hypothetical protein
MQIHSNIFSFFTIINLDLNNIFKLMINTFHFRDLEVIIIPTFHKYLYITFNIKLFSSSVLLVIKLFYIKYQVWKLFPSMQFG